MLNREPIVNASINTQCAQFNCVFANYVTVSDIFVEYLKKHIITNILYINVDKFTRPCGGFSSIISSLCSDSLLTGAYDHVRIHLTESLGITCQFSLDDVNFKFS